MKLWLSFVVLSAVFGSLCSYYIKTHLGAVLSGLIPCTFALGWVLYIELFGFSTGDVPSIWLLAFLVVGGSVTASGLLGFYLGRYIFTKIKTNAR